VHVLAVLKCWQAREAIANVKQQQAVVLCKVSGSATRGSASCPEGDHDMNNLSPLAQLKLEVILYHSINKQDPDGRAINDYFLCSLAKDACYTSNNSLGYKKKMMADEFAALDVANENDNHHAIESAERKIDLYVPELRELEYRHEADLAVYANLTGGEVWKPMQKLKPAPKTNHDYAALRKSVGV
jgi:hypothetical protein